MPNYFYKIFLGTLLSLVGATLQSQTLDGDRYWNDYLTAHQQRGVSLVSYISDLGTFATKEPANTLEYKKSALAYFFATGGKKGFRQTPATAEEHAILVKALSSLAFTYRQSTSKTLNLLEVRKSYGLETTEESIKRHLYAAQTIITETMMVGYFALYRTPDLKSPDTKIGALYPTIQKIYHSNFAQVIPHLLYDELTTDQLNKTFLQRFMPNNPNSLVEYDPKTLFEKETSSFYRVVKDAFARYPLTPKHVRTCRQIIKNTISRPTTLELPLPKGGRIVRKLNTKVTIHQPETSNGSTPILDNDALNENLPDDEFLSVFDSIKNLSS